MTIALATGQAIVDNSLYWWHQASLRALVEFGPLYPAAVADAVRGTFTMDAERYLAQLERAEMVVKVDGPTDLGPVGAQWWDVTDRGRDWAAA